jgi:lipopolysaccharide biosynthesis regulator YciM
MAGGAKEDDILAPAPTCGSAMVRQQPNWRCQRCDHLMSQYRWTLPVRRKVRSVTCTASE